METEIWKDIAGFEGLYQVSSSGRVKSFYGGKETYLKPSSNKGYLNLSLMKDKKKKRVRVHRLVAEAFIPNPDNLPHVNHKDFDRTNNNVENLEWCTQEYNNKYTHKAGRYRSCMKGLTGAKSPFSNVINMYDMKGNFIRSFHGAYEIERECGLHAKVIYSCLEGHCYTALGHLWKYASDNKDMKGYAEELAHKSMARKCVVQIKNGKVLQTFNTISDACKNTGVARNLIRGVAVGRYSQAGGYQWKFAVDL